MQSSTFVRRLALATGSILAHPEQGADFSSASRNFKALGAFFCNYATVTVPARQPESRTLSLEPCTISCGFEASEPYQFRARIQSFQAVAAPFPGDYDEAAP
jgi:hypothetical protein